MWHCLEKKWETWKLLKCPLKGLSQLLSVNTAEYYASFNKEEVELKVLMLK